MSNLIAFRAQDEALRTTATLFPSEKACFRRKLTGKPLDGVRQVTRRALRSVATGGPGCAWLTATGAEPLVLLPGTSRSKERAKGSISTLPAQESEAAQQQAALWSLRDVWNERNNLHKAGFYPPYLPCWILALSSFQ